VKKAYYYEYSTLLDETEMIEVCGHDYFPEIKKPDEFVDICQKYLTKAKKKFVKVEYEFTEEYADNTIVYNYKDVESGDYAMVTVFLH
jgi:hypothetical protein